MASRCRCSFEGHAKQAGPKWLKICFFGLFLKQLDVYTFVFGAGVSHSPRCPRARHTVGLQHTFPEGLGVVQAADILEAHGSGAPCRPRLSGPGLLEACGIESHVV